MFWLRFVRRTPAARLKVGLAVVEGRVWSEKPLVFSGSESRPIYFDRSVESFTTGSRGRGRPMWIPSAAEEQITPFSLEDETGRLWVAAERAAVRVAGGHREVGTFGKTNRSRYVARLILPGDRVRVRGWVDQARKGEPNGLVLRARPGQVLEILFRGNG